VSTFPARLDVRAAKMLASTQRLVNTAHQRLNNIGSQVSALQPGDWTALSLENGWGNLSGYIPAQVRIMQSGLAQITGHISGGTVSSGILIATLPAGYYNPAHAHQFGANVLAGAAAVAVTGAVSGSTDSNTLSDSTISGSTDSNGLSDAYITGSSASAAGPGSHTHGTSGGSGGYIVSNPGHVHTNSGSGQQVSNPYHTHTNDEAGQAASTPVNYNTAVLHLATDGQLTLLNASGSATQISFTQLLPLVTS